MSETRAVYLAVEPDPVQVLYDRPDIGTSDSTAVLIVPPFGWEEACSYRARREWALRLALAGHPTARLDLPGTGDSAGSPTDPGRVGAWIAAVAGAAAWLRETTSAERVAAIGIGLGGLLVCRAAADEAPIDDLILWSVPARGRTLVREMRAHATMIASRYPEDLEEGPPPPEGTLMLVGYLMSAETAGSLGKIDVSKMAVPNAAKRRVLLLGRDRVDPDPKLREHLENAGAAVTVADGLGHAAMMIHPQETALPLGTIEKTIEWLGESAGSESATSGSVLAAPRALEQLRLSHERVELRETPLWFEHDGERRFGVLTEPAEGTGAEITAVLLNGGALRHTGPNRSYVEAARRWAARGIPVLRVDYRGIGDADGEGSELVQNKYLYGPERLGETIAILDQLAARGLPERFALGGLCAAGFWAVHAAAADPRVVGALTVNLWGFFWSPELVAERDRRASRQALRTGLVQRARRGGINARQLRRALRSFSQTPWRAGRHTSIERRQTPEIDDVLDRLRDQGTELLLLLGRGEPLYDQFVREKRLGSMDRWPNLTLEQIPSRDHMFRALWLQRVVADSLDSALDRLLKPSAAAVDPHG